MKLVLIIVLCFLQSFCGYAQRISDIASQHYKETDFKSFDTLSYKATNTRFYLGAFYPEGYHVVYDTKNNRSYYQIADTTASKIYNNQTAQAYLKISKENEVATFIPLQLFEDFDLLQFISIASESLILYKNRYSFACYDTNTQKTSSSHQPGSYKYEGEDAMSPLLGGFTFFDNEKFLFGHVQAYGIFCYDMSNPTQPIELRRYAISENNEGVYFNNQGEYHLFLYPKGKNKWDVLLASSDTASSQSITRLYSRFKEIRYVKKDVFIKLDHVSEPDVATNLEGRVEIQLIDSILSIDLRKGIVIHPQGM